MKESLAKAPPFPKHDLVGDEMLSSISEFSGEVNLKNEVLANLAQSYGYHGDSGDIRNLDLRQQLRMKLSLVEDLHAQTKMVMSEVLQLTKKL